jgi:hypothetical protein
MYIFIQVFENEMKLTSLKRQCNVHICNLRFEQQRNPSNKLRSWRLTEASAMFDQKTSGASACKVEAPLQKGVRNHVRSNWLKWHPFLQLLHSHLAIRLLLALNSEKEMRIKVSAKHTEIIVSINCFFNIDPFRPFIFICLFPSLTRFYVANNSFRRISKKLAQKDK